MKIICFEEFIKGEEEQEKTKYKQKEELKHLKGYQSNSGLEARLEKGFELEVKAPIELNAEKLERRDLACALCTERWEIRAP